MDPELKKLLDGLKAFTAKAFQAIKDDPEYVDLKNGIYQIAFNDGHAAATEAHKGAKTRLEGQVQTAQQEREELKTQLDALKKNNPDAAALHADYGNKIAAKDKIIEDLNAKYLGKEKDRTLNDLEREVADELKAMRVDPDKASVLAQANRKLYNVNDDLTTHILQPGQATAFAGDRKAQVKALATELFKGVDKKFILSKVPGGGSATEGGETVGDADANDKRGVLERAAQAARDKFKKPGSNGGGGGNAPPPSPGEEVNRRLGRTRTSRA